MTPFKRNRREYVSSIERPAQKRGRFEDDDVDDLNPNSPKPIAPCEGLTPNWDEMNKVLPILFNDVDKNNDALDFVAPEPRQELSGYDYDFPVKFKFDGFISKGFSTMLTILTDVYSKNVKSDMTLGFHVSTTFEPEHKPVNCTLLTRLTNDTYSVPGEWLDSFEPDPDNYLIVCWKMYENLENRGDKGIPNCSLLKGIVDTAYLKKKDVNCIFVGGNGFWCFRILGASHLEHPDIIDTHIALFFAYSYMFQSDATRRERNKHLSWDKQLKARDIVDFCHLINVNSPIFNVEYHYFRRQT